MHAKAGEEVLTKVMHECQRRRHMNEVDLTADNCIRRFQYYVNSGLYERFAVEVMNLVLQLDDLITKFPVCSVFPKGLA